MDASLDIGGEDGDDEEETSPLGRVGGGRVLTDLEYVTVCELAQNGKTEELAAFMSHLTEVGSRTLAADQANSRRHSPLTLAARFGRESTVKYLLRAFPGAVQLNPGLEEFTRDPQAVRELRHDLPLYWSSLEGHLEVVKTLVSAGACVNLPNCMQATPLHAAAASGHLRVLEYLISKGADVNLWDHLGTTPLMAAVSGGHQKSVQFLVKKKADINCKNRDGYTVLHLAAWLGQLQLTNKFYGVVSLPEEDPVPSPVFLAASSGHERIVHELLSHQPKCSPLFKSDVYLLLGVGRLKDRNTVFRFRFQYNQGFKDVHDYWKKALALRTSCQSSIVFAKVPAYAHRREMNSAQDLDQVFSSWSVETEIVYQSFLILERCYGYGNHIVVESWHGKDRIEISHRFCNDSFDHRLMEMAVHSWRADLERGVHRHPLYVQHIIENYLQRYSVHLDQHTATMYPAISNTIRALDILQVLRTRYSCEADSIQSILSSLLYIVAAWLYEDYCTFKNAAEGTAVDITSYCGPKNLEPLGQELVSKHLYSVEGKTLLHIALSDHRLAQEVGFLRRFVKESDTLMTPLIHCLVRWGADSAIDIADWNGERPLHLAVKWANKTSGCVDVLTPLIRCGAHLDYVNRKGRTPMEECAGPDIAALFSSDVPPKLACLACRVIVREKVQCTRLNLPPRICRIIECHGGNF